MTEFDKTQWRKPEFAQAYREEADVYIVERRRLFETLKSFYGHFLANKPDNHVRNNRPPKD